MFFIFLVFFDIIKQDRNPKGQSGVDNSETQETLGTKHRTQTNKTQKQQENIPMFPVSLNYPLPIAPSGFSHV
jgi:hypothetical protein